MCSSDLFACDGSHRMQAVGNAQHPQAAHEVHCLTSDAYTLPLAGESVDGITIAFGLRNLHRTDDALREIVVFLSHYAGWPQGARLNSIVEETIAKSKRKKAGF